MRNMFAGDPWYNTKGQQHGVQGMGFRPGPVEVSMVRPMQVMQPSFGQIQMTPLQTQPSIVAQPQIQAGMAPAQVPVAQKQVQNRIPMGTKADCPVCRTFGAR